MSLLNSQIASQISDNFKSWNIIGCKTSIFHSFTMFNKHHKHCLRHHTIELASEKCQMKQDWKSSNCLLGGVPNCQLVQKSESFPFFYGSPDSWPLLTAPRILDIFALEQNIAPPSLPAVTPVDWTVTFAKMSERHVSNSFPPLPHPKFWSKIWTFTLRNISKQACWARRCDR